MREKIIARFGAEVFSGPERPRKAESNKSLVARGKALLQDPNATVEQIAGFILQNSNIEHFLHTNIWDAILHKAAVLNAKTTAVLDELIPKLNQSKMFVDGLLSQEWIEDQYDNLLLARYNHGEVLEPHHMDRLIRRKKVDPSEFAKRHHKDNMPYVRTVVKMGLKTTPEKMLKLGRAILSGQERSAKKTSEWLENYKRMESSTRTSEIRKMRNTIYLINMVDRDLVKVTSRQQGLDLLDGSMGASDELDRLLMARRPDVLQRFPDQEDDSDTETEVEV
jgi:hypothetical protein